MPKPKAKPPKVIIKELEHALETLQHEKANSEKTLLDTNLRLTETITNLKTIIYSQTKERDAEHEAMEKELRVQLNNAHHDIENYKQILSSSKADMAELRTLKAERMNLLRQLSEAVASREEAEKNHALETHDLTTRINSLKTRLETVFNDTLRTAVSDEKKRLALTLDSEAAAALREVGQLRVQVGQQGRQIIQLMRITEEKEQETILAKKEQERATAEAEEISAKYAHHTQVFTEKFALSEKLVLEAHQEMKKAIIYAQALHERNQALLQDNASLRAQFNLPPNPALSEPIEEPHFSSSFHQTMKHTIHRNEHGIQELQAPKPFIYTPSSTAATVTTTAVNGKKEHDVTSSSSKHVTINESPNSTTIKTKSSRPSTARPTIGVDEIYNEIDNTLRNSTTTTTTNTVIRPSSARTPSARPSSSSSSRTSPTAATSPLTSNARTIPISPIHTRLYNRPASAISSRNNGGINVPPPSSVQNLYYNTGNPLNSYTPSSSSPYKQYTSTSLSSTISSSSALNIPNLVTSPMGNNNDNIIDNTTSPVTDLSASINRIRPSSARR